MIESGEKKEEYREIKPYWLNRFKYNSEPHGHGDYYISYQPDTIVFRNGYSKNSPTMTVECKGISIGSAKPEWSDNWHGEVFVISLGEIISKNHAI